MKNKTFFFACLVISFSLHIFARYGETAEQQPDYRFVFENPQILSFDIAMSAEAYEQIQPEQREVNSPERMSSRSMFNLEFNYVEATVTSNGEVYTRVGIRHRGNASMVMIPPGGKKPYKLDFDRFNKEQTFHGFKKLNFINCFRDPSMLRDKLTYDLMQKVGVPAPRATFANLYLTIEGKEREYLGLYIVVEQVDSVFLQDRFGNSDGLLIKGEIINDLEYRGDDWEAYAHDYELKSNKENSDTSLLINFLKFVSQASDEQFAAEINQYLNVDRFLAWLAVNTLLTNFDSYAGLGHNWYLYYNTASKKFEHIPWDVNEAFGNLQLGDKPEQMLEFDIYRPYVGEKILIRRLLAVEKYKEQYLAYLREFNDGVFAPETMYAEIDRLHEFIKDAVETDAYKIYPTAAFEKSINDTVKPIFPVFSNGIIGLKPFVAGRVASVKAQLAGAKEGYKFEYSPMENTSPPAPQAMEEIDTRKKAMEARLEQIEASIQENPMNAQLYAEKELTMAELAGMSEPAEQMKYALGMTEAFEKSLELDPENILGHFGRGLVRLFTPEAFGGDLDGAISDFEFVLNKEPSNVQTHFFIAFAYNRKGLKDKAIAHFEKVLELDPQNQQAKQELEKLK
jgi:tetratricopeptide (TPR) repeat protein